MRSVAARLGSSRVFNRIQTGNRNFFKLHLKCLSLLIDWLLNPCQLINVGQYLNTHVKSILYEGLPAEAPEAHVLVRKLRTFVYLTCRNGQSQVCRSFVKTSLLLATNTFCHSKSNITSWISEIKETRVSDNKLIILYISISFQACQQQPSIWNQSPLADTGVGRRGDGHQLHYVPCSSLIEVYTWDGRRLS